MTDLTDSRDETRRILSLVTDASSFAGLEAVEAAKMSNTLACLDR